MLDEDLSQLSENVLLGEFYQAADPLTYRLLKNFVSKHRKFPTQAESFLWEQLRDNKLNNYSFRRQHIIGNFIVDFICLSKKLIIEVDGLTHQLPENKISDEERTLWLQTKGYIVIRFSNEEILFNTEYTLNRIKQKLNELPFSPKKTYETSKKDNEQTNKDISISEVSATDSSPVGGSRMGAVYISLPGVPHEMKGLTLDSVIPKLKETFDLPVILHKTLLTSGIGESMIADTIADFENNLPSHFKLAYLPAYGMVRLRLTARGNDINVIEKELDNLFKQLKSLLKEWMVADEDSTLQEAVIQLLKSKKKTVSTAESCTGGNIAHLITSIAGSSAVYMGSIVSYANEAKENLLGVKEETLKQFGAVSEQTVIEMVHGALKELKTDYAIATSGIMGPDGGTLEKPVGTVWIAVGNNDKTRASKHFFRFDRERNIELTTHTAITMLFRFVKEQEGE